VTSNANLNEFTRNALYEYLTIFARVMKDDGIFLVQCTGFPAHGSTEDLMEVLHKFGFASIFCGMADDNVRSNMLVSSRYRSLGLHRKKFALNNLILVKKGHPHYQANVGLKNFAHGHASEFPRLNHIYEGGTEEPHVRGLRRIYSIDDTLQSVRAKLRQESSHRGGRATLGQRDGAARIVA